MLLNCGFGEDSWVPWTTWRSNHSILKEISLWCSLEELMLKLKLQYFGHLMWRADSFEKTLMLVKFEGRRRRWQQRVRCLDGITDSMTSVWVNLGSWWWTGRPSVLQFMGSQRVRHNWETELNWTEWSSGFPYFLQFLSEFGNKEVMVCVSQSAPGLIFADCIEFLHLWLQTI